MAVSVAPISLVAQELKESKNAEEIKNSEELRQLDESKKGEDQSKLDPRLKAVSELLKEGKVDEARAKMEALAATDDGGLPMAHFWLARDLLVQNRQARAALDPKALPGKEELEGIRVASVERLVEAQSRLDQAVALKPDFARAHALRANIVERRGGERAAAEMLAPAVAKNPGLRLQLARLWAKCLEPEKAKEEAKLAVEHFSTMAKANPDAVGAHVLWIQAEMFLNRSEEVGKILGVARKHAPEEKRYKTLFVSWQLRKAAVAMKGDPKKPADALKSFRAALDVAPGAREVMVRLSQLGTRFPETRPEIRKLLTEVAAKNPKNPSPHALLGIQSVRDKDMKTAITHFEKALALNADLHGVQHNMAWALAHVEPPQYERALEVVGKAVEGAQKIRRLQYLDTRASIYRKMERYADAIEDYKVILKSNRNLVLHATMNSKLADLYEKLGKPVSAKNHRALAERAKNANKNELWDPDGPPAAANPQ